MEGEAHSTPTASPPSAPVAQGPRLPHWGIRAGALVAVAAAAAFGAWLVFSRGNDNETSSRATVRPTTTLTGNLPAPTVARPSIASTRGLRAAAAASSVPIYWAGVRSGTKFELTLAPRGTVFLRYLPSRASAGDTRAFLTVATYPRPKAFAEVQRAAADAKIRTIDVAGGGIAVYNPAHTTNVHIAYPGQPYQIEVFSPQRRGAVQLVESGAVRPVD
jgi:hypothetical protein